MRANIFLTILVCVTYLISCLGQKDNVRKQPPKQDFQSDSAKCIFKESLSANERKSIYPFSKAKSVKIVSFEALPDSNGQIITGANKLPMKLNRVDVSKLNEIIQLNSLEIDSLTNILYNFGYNGKVLIERGSCFNPRHAIIFFDNANVDFAFIELCFECNVYQTSSSLVQTGDFCTEKYNMLESYFKNRGIRNGWIKE